METAWVLRPCKHQTHGNDQRLWILSQWAFVMQYASKPQRCASCVREHSLPQSGAEHGHHIHSAMKFHAKHQGGKVLILKRDGQRILIHIKKQAPKPPNHDPEKSLCDSVLIVLKSLLLLLNLVLFPPLVRVSDLLAINTC